MKKKLVAMLILVTAMAGCGCGDSGFHWGGSVGGDDTFEPITDGYGDGTTIIIEPTP